MASYKLVIKESVAKDLRAIPNKDVEFLREKLLVMYANPVINYLAASR